MTMESRVLTEDEVRAAFLARLRHYVAYWSRTVLVEGGPCAESSVLRFAAMDSLVFSILALLDGEDVDFPAWHLSPSPHPEDEEYLRAHGRNWFPADCNITGSLHEQWRQDTQTPQYPLQENVHGRDDGEDAGHH